MSIFKFPKLVQDCFSIINSMKGAKKITLVNDSPLDMILHTDYHRLKRIILNLLTNALKYTTEGTIAVRGRLTFEDPTVAEIEVSDSGAGMDEDAQIKLFKEFNSNVEGNKGAAKSVVNRDGIGLGLSTSLGLVEKLGPLRKIDVKSAKGKGSRFSFLIYQDYAKSIAERKNRSSSRLSFEKPKIDTKPRTSVLEQIFNTEERPIVLQKPPGTAVPTGASPMSKIQDQKLQPQSKSKIEVSSWGKDSGNRKKVNVLIVEGSSLQIHEMRAVLQKSFQLYSEDFVLNFHYNEKIQNCLEEIISFEARKQACLHFVIVALESTTPADTQKHISAMIHKTVSYWGDKKHPAAQVLLINNTSARLKSYLGLESGESPALSQLQIFNGYPNELQLRKFLSLWINKFLPECS